MKNIPEREQIPEMYASGMSARQIGARVGLTVGAVYSILKARGVKPRNPRQAHEVRYPDGRYGNIAANWRGGRRKLPRGGALPGHYVFIYMPEHLNATKQGYVMEHRLVMEQVLGRLLTKDEIVHHKNGVRSDNRPENLEVLSRGEHTRGHFAAVTKLAKMEAEVAALKARLGES